MKQTKQCRQCKTSFSRSGFFCKYDCYKEYMRGENNPAKTPTAKQRLSQFRKGVPLSAETRRKQSITLKETLKDPAIREARRQRQLGKKLSDETKRKIVETKAKRPKKISSLKKLADTYFSIYIRKREADWRGYATCVTCGKVDEWKKMHCGHYISRGVLATRFDEQNCHTQCPRCNIFLNGNYASYSLYLINKYGNNIIKELHERSKTINQLGYDGYKEITDKYKSLISP